jgi:hypothetical protein
MKTPPSLGVTGRSSIPEASRTEPRSRGVLDIPLSRRRVVGDAPRRFPAHTRHFPPRLKAKFAFPIKLIPPVQSSIKKYSVFRPAQISSLSATVRFPKEGRLAIVTNAEPDAMDAGGVADERHRRGRQRRVVLTPRRWRQVLR